MLRELPSVLAAYEEVYSPHFDLSVARQKLPYNPLLNDASGIRPLSAVIEDSAFGDSGKGNIVTLINERLAQLSPDGVIYSYRYNGGSNAGHEVERNGVKIATHQLPVAVLQERAIAIMGKGMLIHPPDLVTEIAYVEKKAGNTLPGTLLIDFDATVTTDIHRAYEQFTNQLLDVGQGATGSGIAQGYATIYEKRAIKMWHLYQDNWEDIFKRQYKFYATLMGGEDELAQMEVNSLTIEGGREKIKVGTEGEFIDRLRNARTKLEPYISNFSINLLEHIWRYDKKPVSIEAANGAGLDPFAGVYSDVTASRPIGRVGIPDSTAGIIMYDEIAFKVSVGKLPYMSSVGSRRAPYGLSGEIAAMYRNENDERGRSTGRDREMLPEDLELLRAMQRFAQYDYSAWTHLDAAHKDIPVAAVLAYRNKKTHLLEEYKPDQRYWDEVEPIEVALPSWDGVDAAKARTPEQLPEEALRILALLGKVTAPVAMVTNGRKSEDVIYWFGGN